MRSRLDQRPPITRQLTQLTLRAVGDEAGPQQSMPKQIGDPLHILDVRLAGGHRLDVLSVDLCRSTNAIRSSSSLTEVLVKHAAQTIPAQYGSCLRGLDRCPLPRDALGE
jgi:hypothetical protein